MKPLLSRLLERALPVYHRLARPMTLGVRFLGFDANGRVFLVRHVHRDGWYLPGGGVEPGETARQALEREAREEGNLVLVDEPALAGIFRNPRQRGDHVLLYRGLVEATGPKTPDREIAEGGFFAPADWPEDLTPATRRRLIEWRSGAPQPGDW